LSKRPAGALAGIAMILTLAAPVGATASFLPSPRGAPGVAEPASPRDVVLGNSTSRAAARFSADATTARYPLGDGTDDTVAIGVTDSCRATCTAADPARIAAFIGTLIHGPEVELLTIQVQTRQQIAYECGSGAQACYYTGQNRIVIAGDDVPAPDGASRDFVLAHEYGHHLARHRRSPRPFPAAIDWGTPRWSSHENICRSTRVRQVFPGSGGLHYFRDPGEAFAEAFARYHFPESGVPWRWLPSLRPDAEAFRAIREDTLVPWRGRGGLLLTGRLRGRRGGPTVRTFGTPLDGTVSLRPAGSHRSRYRLRLLNRTGRVLRSAGHLRRPDHRLDFTVCGQSRLRVALESHDRAGAFKLRIQRP
jgi:hypothetical protein